MHLTSYLQNGHLTVALTGEIDHHCAKAFIETIISKIEAYTPKECILDFQDVSFMDSSGIALILKVHRRMHQRGGRAWVENAENPPLRVIDASGIDRIVNVSLNKEV